MSSRNLGLVQVMLAGACFGFLGYFGKTAFQAGLLPNELLSLRFLVSALMLLFVRPWQLPLRTITISFLLGALGYAVFSSFYFKALQGLSASLTVLLLYTYPAIVTVGARVFFKEQLGRRGISALIISLIGMTGLVWGEWQVSQPTYLLFGFGAAVFYATYILISGKVLSGVPATQSTFYILVGAGVTLGLMSFTSFERPLFILQEHAVLILGMAFVCSLMAMTLFQAGLQKLSSSEASIVSTSEPFFGVLIATWLLNEQLSVMQLAGGGLVLTAMLLVASRRG